MAAQKNAESAAGGGRVCGAGAFAVLGKLPCPRQGLHLAGVCLRHRYGGFSHCGGVFGVRGVLSGKRACVGRPAAACLPYTDEKHQRLFCPADGSAACLFCAVRTGAKAAEKALVCGADPCAYGGGRGGGIPIVVLGLAENDPAHHRVSVYPDGPRIRLRRPVCAACR